MRNPSAAPHYTSPYFTTKSHLADLIQHIRAAMQDRLHAGRFTDADALRPELAWLASELSSGHYLSSGSGSGRLSY